MNNVSNKFCCFCTGKAKTARTPKSVQKTEKRPPPHCDSPVFLSDSDDDSNIVIKSTWRTRHSRPPSEELHTTSKNREETAKPCVPPPAVTVTTHSSRDDTCSSEEEFQSLLDRVRQNQSLGGRTLASPKPPPGTAHSSHSSRMWFSPFWSVECRSRNSLMNESDNSDYLKYSGFISKFWE